MPKWFKWIILVLIIIAMGIVTFFLMKRVKNNNTISTIKKESPSGNKNLIKNLGFNLDYYNPATNKAGDIEFVKFKAPYDRVFTDYGQTFWVENPNERKELVNVHPSIMLPAGTKILAPIDGVVIDVPKLYSDDYSVQITSDGKMNGLIFELEHVKNPIIKKGDKVKAGDPVAEVTDFTSQYHPGYGYFDLAVFSTKEDGQPQHHCPFLYLNDSIKEEVFNKIRALYVSWEEYSGDKQAYNENVYSVPGCITIEPLDG